MTRHLVTQQPVSNGPVFSLQSLQLEKSQSSSPCLGDRWGGGFPLLGGVGVGCSAALLLPLSAHPHPHQQGSGDLQTFWVVWAPHLALHMAQFLVSQVGAWTPGAEAGVQDCRRGLGVSTPIQAEA